jgi:hypothetical protein
MSRRLAGDGADLAALLDTAPSVAVARHLWRQLEAAWRDRTAADAGGVTVTLFALPIVIVAALERADGKLAMPCILEAPQMLADILREHDALAGKRNFALADALVATEAIDVARLPEISAWLQLPDALAPGAALPARVLVPAPIILAAAHENVHLRFLIGSALTKPGADVVAGARVGPWGLAFTRELGRQLALAGASVLAIPRAPMGLLPAVHAGRAAQREVGAQIFASNAIRKLRAATGEPTAVISAHCAADAPGGGELRLSLSSVFETRDAEGFRCPLYPQERVGDVVTMLIELLRDCRINDIRLLPGVHPDRDPGTGLPLLFKPDTLPTRDAPHLH